jgi:hypothetical protein
MFFIGCNQCPRVAQAPCKDKIDAMVISLLHERECHRDRWNQTKQATLEFAMFWQHTEVIHVVEAQGRVC